MILRDTSCPPDPRVCQLCNIVIGELRKSRTSFHPTSCFLMETDATSVEIHQLYFQRHNLHWERLNNGQICHFFPPLLLCWSGWICSCYAERKRTKELLSAEHNTRCLLPGSPELILKPFDPSSQQASQLRFGSEGLFKVASKSALYSYTWVYFEVYVAAWPRDANVLGFFFFIRAPLERFETRE